MVWLFVAHPVPDLVKLPRPDSASQSQLVCINICIIVCTSHKIYDTKEVKKFLFVYIYRPLPLKPNTRKQNKKKEDNVKESELCK